ncbi:MAG: hypothetical protein EB075_04360 [Bacteroidetes bacterium]|nr:hypothetical protein [Bacteroidota bacterium]
MPVAVPVPAIISLADLNQGPELKETPPVAFVDLMDVESQAAFRERGDAANTGVAIGVAGNATIHAADAVLMEEAQGAADDF